MSPVAYRRAIAHGDGWYGFNQTEEAAATSIAGLKTAALECGEPARFDELEISVTPNGAVTAERVAHFAELNL